MSELTRKRDEITSLRAKLAEAEGQRDDAIEMLEPYEAVDRWAWQKVLRIAQRIIDRHYPASVFTGISGDPGPRLVAALRDCLAAAEPADGEGKG